ncbi:MAG: hypothetical protein AAFV07_19350, partial [Bacteroidota bacterium]
MPILHTHENQLQFILHKEFTPRLFSPIGGYVNWKLEHAWDDYNELFHAMQYMEQVKKTDGVWFDMHTLEKEGTIKGVLTIVGGDLA